MKYYSMTVFMQIDKQMSLYITVLDIEAISKEEVLEGIVMMIGEYTDLEVIHVEEHDKPAHHVELH
jgi:hypothetical protein